VRLAWTSAATPAASYDVYRDGSKIGSSTGLTFRDSAVTPGATYSYRVRTVDSYGQTSALTAAVTAFIDPALNQAPTVTVTSWPALAPTNGKTLLRVCGSDVDAQVLTLALGTDSGLLEPTDDPSIWYYTP
jgi:chitodextrinase